MQTIKKIHAFTLGEMIIVLILSSIVVGLAFSVLSLVQSHMLSIQENYQKNTELSKLEALLYLDFNRYTTITYNPLEQQLNFETPLDTVHYQFSEQYISRKKDTFHIPIARKQFYFNGAFCNDGPIDAIQLFPKKPFQAQQLFIFKYNAAATHIK